NMAPSRTLPGFFILSAMLFFAEWGLSTALPRWAAIVLYLHVVSLSAVVVSGFWSVINERFDPFAAKQLIGRIGGGATFGGMLGAAAAWLGASALDIPTMIFVLGLLNLACAVGVLQIGGGDSPSGSSEGGVGASALVVFQETPYLRNLAVLVALGAFGQTVYDYVFKAGVAAYFDTGAELVSFFALFYLGISVLTFLAQNLLARRSLARFGLATTVATLPVSSTALGFIALLFPGLSSAVAMRAGVGVTENSLFRSGYELLYTPVLPEKKRPTKALIDVGGDKVGTALGGSVAFLMVGIFPGFASPLLISAGIAASLASLYVTRRLHQGYVSSLTERLRAGTLTVEEVQVADATTQLTVSDAVAAMQRSADRFGSIGATPAGVGGVRLADIRERLDRDERSVTKLGEALPAPPPRPFVPVPDRSLAANEIDSTLVAIANLRSGDTDRNLATLTSHHPLSPELISYVIPMLGEAGSAEAAAAALQRVAPVYTGTLLDAVLRSRTSLPVRRSLCEILGRLPTQRSANGLIELLHDTSFELRFRAAAKLLQIHRVNDKLRIPRDFLFMIAEREAADSRRRWQSQVALDPRLMDTSLLESAQGKRVSQGLTFIATLLLILLEREPLQLAIRALTSGLGGQRGTGLEYLENVLPASLFSELIPLLEDDKLTHGGLKSRSMVLTEVVAGDTSAPVDLEALRKHIDAVRRRGAELRDASSESS
ncbi:MAG: hypothetical protein V3T64_00915, partial [Myxococcota bacterium]